MTQLKRPFALIDFTLSFRSSGAVLEFVNRLIGKGAHYGLGEESPKPHATYHTLLAGLVEVWPIIQSEPPRRRPIWPYRKSPKGMMGRFNRQNVWLCISNPCWRGRTGSFWQVDFAARYSDPAAQKGQLFCPIACRAGTCWHSGCWGGQNGLENQIEILDLLALGDVCLLPEDDLQLAVLLKSPLIGLSEEALLELATSRADKSLFDQLIRFEGAANAYGEAVNKILKARQLSQNLPVFEFFSTILAQGGRAAFHRRLGHAVDESLDAFLLRARDHGQHGQPGLSHFYMLSGRAIAR